MDLFSVLKKDLIIVPLKETTKDGIISCLVDRYASYNNVEATEAAAIKEEILKRELLGSTAMENGIAIPHVKLDNLEQAQVVIGISRLPIDFGGAEKTKVFFLVLAPKSQPSEHIQILASIARACSSQVFVRLLSASKSADEVYQLFFD